MKPKIVLEIVASQLLECCKTISSTKDTSLRPCRSQQQIGLSIPNSLKNNTSEMAASRIQKNLKANSFDNMALWGGSNKETEFPLTRRGEMDWISSLFPSASKSMEKF